MDQQSTIRDIERRAKAARVPIAQLCRRAGIHPVTFFKWRKGPKNPDPVGANFHSIEALYRDAVRWYQILPRYRPPNGVQQLRNLSVEVTSIAKALRGDRVGVQGVALTVRLLTDGCQSPLYANELGPLREELNRIRYLLETADGRDTERSRAA